jgi:hypothetical protein
MAVNGGRRLPSCGEATNGLSRPVVERQCEAVGLLETARDELSAHIEAIRFKPWPQELKRNIAFHLMHLRLQLRDGLSNLRIARVK